ncbi:MAG: response regulator [Alphaproteobacteria bacterium]
MVNRVLIVDDNMMMRQLLASQLGALGYKGVSKAVNGVDAMNQLIDSAENDNPFDLVLLDWSMPEMNGLDFLVKCRDDERFAKTAIIMITSESEQANMMKALEAGATSYLIKPFSPPALQEKIKEVTAWIAKTKLNANV